MQDRPAAPTQSCANLDDEVLAQLDLEAGWLTSHALLQRCDFARDSDQLGECLSRLHRKGKLQRVHGDVGLLYGPLGIEPPSRSVTTGAPKLPTLHDLNRQAATAHVVKLAAMEAPARSAAPEAAAPPVPAPASAALATGRNMPAVQAREAVLALIRRAGRVQIPQIRQALGLTAPACKYHLQLMQKAGLIERTGTTSSSWYQLATPRPVPAEAPPIEPAAQTVTEAAVETAATPANVATLAQAIQSAAAEAASRAEPEAAPRAVDVWPELRPRLLALLATQPLWRAQDLMPRLGKSPNSITAYLSRLEEEGAVQRVGRGMATRWALVGAPVEVPARPRGLEATAAAAETAEPPAPGRVLFQIQQGDFALWSDGTLEIRSDDVDVILAKPAQAALRNYLLGMGDLP